jgi:rhodanese-related sulfurtransferase
MTLSPDLTMEELLHTYPGAQRALFRHYHIGGCASCGFRPDETLAEVCQRNDAPEPEEVMEKIREAHAQDEKVLISPTDAATARSSGAHLLDIRTREEFEAVHIEGAELFSQDLVQTIMSTWPKETSILIVDHTGSRGLDAAAYFSGHGFTNVRALRGGIDAWSLEVDPSLPRYSTE